MTKLQQQIEHVVVTAFEAAIAYIAVAPNVQFNKTLLAGAAGAALSAVYNVLRQSTPTIAPTKSSGVTPTLAPDSGVMNGVPQLTSFPQPPVETPNSAVSQ